MTRKNKPVIAFVCIGNSCRSQIAEAFAKGINQSSYGILSAGSFPSGEVNPRAISLMQELGYDMSAQKSTGIGSLEGEEIEARVTMGCGDSCPNISSKQNIDWQIPDPKRMSLDEFRSVRDHIRGRVEGLFKSLLNC